MGYTNIYEFGGINTWKGDIVTFTFKDGSTLRYEFEDQNIVKEDGKRYQVDGLSSLRSILNNMIEEE